jgi:hypothetical protein
VSIPSLVVFPAGRDSPFFPAIALVEAALPTFSIGQARRIGLLAISLPMSLALGLAATSSPLVEVAGETSIKRHKDFHSPSLRIKEVEKSRTESMVWCALSCLSCLARLNKFRKARMDMYSALTIDPDTISISHDGYIWTVEPRL